MKNKSKIKLSLNDIKVQSFAIPVNKNLQNHLYGGASAAYTCDDTQCQTATTQKPGWCTTDCCNITQAPNC